MTVHHGPQEGLDFTDTHRVDVDQLTVFDAIEEDDPCCLLYRELYPADHEHGCPTRVARRVPTETWVIERTYQVLRVERWHLSVLAGFDFDEWVANDQHGLEEALFFSGERQGDPVTRDGKMTDPDHRLIEAKPNP